MIVWLASYPAAGKDLVKVLLETCFELPVTSDNAEDNQLDRMRVSVDLNVVMTEGGPSDQSKAIYLFCDPLINLTALSRSRHWDLSPAELAVGTAIPSWSDHLASWNERSTPTLMLRVEDVLFDPGSVLGGLAQFLGVPVKPDGPEDFHAFVRNQNLEQVFGELQSEADALPFDIKNLVQCLFRQQIETLGYPVDPNLDVPRAHGYFDQILLSRGPGADRAVPDALRLTAPVESCIETEPTSMPQDIGRDIIPPDFYAQHPTAGHNGLPGQTADDVENQTDSHDGVESQLLQGANGSASEHPAGVNANSPLPSISPQKRLEERALDRPQDRYRPGEQGAAQLSEPVSWRDQFGAATDAQKILDADDFAERLVQLEQELEAARQAASRVTHELKTQRAQFADLEHSISEKNDIIRLLEQRTADLSGENARSLLESEGADSADTRALAAGLEDLKQACDRLRVDLDERNNKIAEMSAKGIERENQIKSLEKSLGIAKQREKRLLDRNGELVERFGLTQERLVEVHAAVAPRLRSLMTLKPLRYIMKQRSLIKSGKVTLDEQGVPLPTGQVRDRFDIGSSDNVDAPLRPRYLEYDSTHAHTSSSYADYEPSQEMGIAVYAFDRIDCLENVLESLSLQNALGSTHVWIDGDQGKPDKRKLLDKTEELAASYNVKAVHRNRGNYGFRKMMIVSMRRMMEHYDRILFLEDDCFPTRQAVKGFQYELDEMKSDPSVLTVYGHHFKVDGENGRFPRFQGWGWAAETERLYPVWEQLRELYLMSEDEYLAFVNEHMTQEVIDRIDVTPGRQPSSTLPRFFAWDETLGLLAALHGMTHRPSSERLIYNFGAGHGSTHFTKVEHYRKPPFNMISIEELWNYF